MLFVLCLSRWKTVLVKGTTFPLVLKRGLCKLRIRPILRVNVGLWAGLKHQQSDKFVDVLKHWSITSPSVGGNTTQTVLHIVNPTSVRACPIGTAGTVSLLQGSTGNYYECIVETFSSLQCVCVQRGLAMFFSLLILCHKMYSVESLLLWFVVLHPRVGEVWNLHPFLPAQPGTYCGSLGGTALPVGNWHASLGTPRTWRAPCSSVFQQCTVMCPSWLLEWRYPDICAIFSCLRSLICRLSRFQVFS